MKTLAQIIAVTLAIASSALAAVTDPSPEIVVALSPFQSATERTNQEALLQRFLLRDRPASTHITIWDGWNLRIICDIPSATLAYDSPAARAPRLAPAFTALRQWFNKAGAVASPAGLENCGAIKIPEWLEAVSVKPATGQRTLVILASPFAQVPSEPSYSMVQTRYPSDGHLARTSLESLYGVADKQGHLANNVILWAYGSENVWASQHHRECVTRWWSLFIANQGSNAMLASFSCDAPQILQEALHPNHRPLGEYVVNTKDSMLVMHIAAEREVPIDLPPAKPTPSLEPIVQRAVTPPPILSPKVEPVSKPPTAPAPAVVNLDVGVTDSTGTPVSGLSKADFTVSEDGVIQRIASFSADRKPISLVILIDVSGSIGSKLDRIRAAASSIIHQGGEHDEYAVLKFTSDTTVVQSFTSDALSADRSLATLHAGGETALLDALKFALAYANQNGKNQRKGIVLLTDGGENGSQATSRADLITLLQQGTEQFFSVAFPEGLDQGQSPDSRGRSRVKSQPTEALARDLLDTLAHASSGGRVFYPRQDAELGSIADTIVSDLRTPRYTLGYYPSRPQPDAAGWRSVHVLVCPSAKHGPLTARSRAGYFAGQPDELQPAVFSNKP
jgi:VWFA-related protein